MSNMLLCVQINLIYSFTVNHATQALHHSDKYFTDGIFIYH